jgi:CheY-like chemotaxis protein
MARVGELADMPRAVTLRVVVAEDGALLRAAIAEVLRRDGHVVEELEDGTQLLMRVSRALAARATPQEGIDVIISDVRMPGSSGLDVLRKLRRARRAIPFLVITADSDPMIRAAAAELRAGFLPKPFTMAQLRHAVSELLAAASA